MITPPDPSVHYDLQAYSQRPLDVTTIHGLAIQIQRICIKKQIPWALIGGGAVALHLFTAGHPSADSRASCDLDVAASDLISDAQITWIAPLLAGGMVGKLNNRRIDWLVRKGGHEPLRCLQNRIIATANALPGAPAFPAAKPRWAFPVATPDSLCALKLCLSTRSFRPKDRWDCRLLIDAGLANIDAITWWLRETVSDTHLRDNAQRNLDRLLPLPLLAA